MNPLPEAASNTDFIAFVDRWAALMEQEDYEAAFAFTDHDPDQGWTPGLLRDVVKAYGAARADQRVTVTGVPTDIRQRKTVDRWPPNVHGEVGEIWYDLNIDGRASDLTATFRLVRASGGLIVSLDDIHVM